ncbi:class I SAM-dependent methyltransferase [Vibrio panuliri]|uniref:Methyltransferase n=1 Tax=Vibrio panuliri TaxID=1381081 RepID=A0A1Q9HHC4_9VIBR|nr:class I SAM-dependent methyltransferase [Vibrio panuliri]KAB1460964.1 class I SAM-dependent methyltransferase [Vibrio panuliri]OLQ89388.1 methyltransferase [Vibrio panuliri]OLQ96255.1 methyltransferase [Vibrio panuliri]
MASPQRSPKTRYQIPANLLQPLWFRSRESLADDGLVYDPIAANACHRCKLAPECFAGDIDQKQLLHATLTQLCDDQVNTFLKHNPDGWIINVGAGLDTRFYRIDNGLCHWIELDVTENLLWRQKLFHNSERYHHHCGSVIDLSWLDEISIPENAPVMIVCEHALLDMANAQVASFVQTLGRHFDDARACLVLAGDLSQSKLGQKMGSGEYAHGYESAKDAMTQYLPWLRRVRTFSPLDKQCRRWKWWQRWLTKLASAKHRFTPVVVLLRW